MARKPRIHYPGAVYHVILKGNAGGNIFFGDGDRLRFLELIGNGVRRFGYRVFAYCLMSNHVHLLVQVADIPLSRIMHNLSFRYTAYLNRRLHRTGHVFHGRYKAILVDADNYLLQLVRYIHNNPVEAGVAEVPGSYKWSSHSAYLGKGMVRWVKTRRILSLFSDKREIAIDIYLDYMLQGVTGAVEDVLEEVDEHGILGGDRFKASLPFAVEQVSRREPGLDEIIQQVCEAYQLKRAELLQSRSRGAVSEARAVLAWLVRENGRTTLTELSRLTRPKESSLSKAARRIEARAEDNAELGARLNALKETCFK